MTACIACGHDVKEHDEGGCEAVGLYVCPCRLTERVFTRAETLAYGERVALRVIDAARNQLRNGETQAVVDLVALLDGEGT
jgi:hypothetical protein